MVIVAVSFDISEYIMKVVLLDIVEIPDGSAKTLSDTVIDVIQSRQIGGNFIGFCADTCNAMFGRFNSVSTILKQKYPDIALVKCTCHSLHLCASYASRKLPKSIEDLCKNVFNHFNSSPKRSGSLREFQQFFETDEHKLLQAGKTRWLGLKSCVDRLIEQYEVLREYFTLQVFEDPSGNSDMILRSLKNPFTLAYLEFMSFNLERFTSFNLLFQSELPLLHTLESEVERLLKSLCIDYLPVKYVRDLNVLGQFDPQSDQMLPLSRVYLGPRATATLSDIIKELGPDNENVKSFQSQCRDFLIEATEQVKERFSGLEDLRFLRLLLPQNAQGLNPASLSGLYDELTYLHGVAPLEKVDAEWRSHIHITDTDVSVDSHTYWKKVTDARNLGGNLLYPNLRKIVSVLFSLPFSNAPAERLFSLLRNIKTEKRNRLKEQSLVALMQSSCRIQDMRKTYRDERPRYSHAAHFDVTERFTALFKKMNTSATNGECKILRNEFIAKL
jgi:hypothetical protein